ncbi:MAG: polysaccharide deacetylase family protein, partial [Actinomycetes bacterium]
ETVPRPSTPPAVLNLLWRNGAEATFFLLGRAAERWPELVGTEISSGMEIGNHTWNHPHLLSLSPDQVALHVSRTTRELAQQGAVVALFRPPYGEIETDQLRSIEDVSGLRVLAWTYVIDHYVGGLGLTPSEAERALSAEIQPGDIVLAHDAHLLEKDGGGGRTDAMATLRQLVPALRSTGYGITTVSQLLARGAPVKMQQGRWFWQSGPYCP